MRRERAGWIAEVVDERRVGSRCDGRLRRCIAGSGFEVVVRAIAVLDLRHRVVDRRFHVGHVDQTFGLVERARRPSRGNAVQRVRGPHGFDGVGVPVERHLRRERRRAGVTAHGRGGGRCGDRAADECEQNSQSFHDPPLLRFAGSHCAIPTGSDARRSRPASKAGNPYSLRRALLSSLARTGARVRSGSARRASGRRASGHPRRCAR